MCPFGSSLATYGVAFHKHRHISILLCSFPEFPPTCSAEPSRRTVAPSKVAGRPWQLSLASGPAPGAEPSAAKSVTSAAGGHIVQPKCQPGWQLKWGQIFAASAADIMSGSGVSVCQTLDEVSSVQTQVLPFSFSFPPYLLCSLHCSIPAAIPSL